MVFNSIYAFAMCMESRIISEEICKTIKWFRNKGVNGLELNGVSELSLIYNSVVEINTKESTEIPEIRHSPIFFKVAICHVV